MATIFTVHGSFASGPDTGDKWWQRGGPLERDLRNYVSAVDGDLRFEPFVWNGENRENARRSAGSELQGRLQAEEVQNLSYCLVGHSHGGSVIGHAICGVISTTQMPNLSSWTTVGTPFIETKRNRSAFLRLGRFGRSVYLFALMILLFLAFGIFGDVYKGGLMEYIRMFPSRWLDHVYEMLLFGVPTLVLIVLTKYSRTKLRDREYFTSLSGSPGARNKPLWLWHATDEAIQALQSAKSLTLNASKKDKFATAISALSILIVPSLVYLATACDHCVQTVTSFWNESAGPLGRVRSPPAFTLDRVTLLIVFYLELPYTLLKYVLGPHLYYVEEARPTLASILIFLSTVISLTALFGISWLIHFAATLLGRAVSGRLSFIFNAFVSEQVRLAAFGSDTEAEYAIGASPHPQWVTAVPRALPDELADEISAKSDKAAAEAIPQIRRAISKMGGNPADIFEILAIYPWGNELVHTTYFDVPAFRKLVAYAIAQGKGFEATDAFKADPDYAVVCRWYSDLRASV